MPKYLFLAFTNPTEGQEDEFNRWYDNQHIPDVIDVPGFVSARRFRLDDYQYPLNQVENRHRYLALYEIETDDVAKTLEELRGRIGTPKMVMSDSLDLNGLFSPVFVQIGGPVMGEDVRRERAKAPQPA
jgi:hypothetical protein